MSANYQSLTEKEKQTLRLIVRGHDAKSVARHLGLSVHTINERLRDARRKLEVSSSREAARQLFEREGSTPQNQADKQIGDAPPVSLEETEASGTARKPTGVIIAGAIIMSIVAALFALSLLADQPAPSAATSSPPSPTVAVVESDAVRAARDWLVLGDQGRWNDGWQATATSFRKANTAAQWADAATKVRGPMGALISRTALSQESVPAPPAGVEVVKFRTSFANRADVTETVSLVREGSAWRVVGIYVD
jgi:DNA-binding CsgD family transcriptional regulator